MTVSVSFNDELGFGARDLRMGAGARGPTRESGISYIYTVACQSSVAVTVCFIHSKAIFSYDIRISSNSLPPGPGFPEGGSTIIRW